MEAGNRMKPPYFYGTISHPSNQPIRISGVFMERHGDSLGDSVFLKDSDLGETIWKVELRTIDGETWFDKGWKEFAAFYSIQEGYLLMFEYKGESRFLVTIFDKTSNEISYPVDPRLQILPVKEEPKEEEEEEEEEEDYPVPVKKRGKVKQNLQMSKNIISGDSDPPLRASRYSMLHGKQKLRACEMDFKSKHPYFATELKASHLSNPFIVHIPVQFLKSHFAMNKIGGHGLKFKLRLSDQETEWPVVVTKYSNFVGGRIFGPGWKRLTKEKGLTLGELCIFELLKKQKTFVVYRIQ